MGLETNPLSTAAVVLLHLLSLLAAVSAKLKTSDIQFDYFNDTYNLGKAFQVDSPATIHNDALQITPDSVNSPFLANVAGRIIGGESELVFRIFCINGQRNTTELRFAVEFDGGALLQRQTKVGEDWPRRGDPDGGAGTGIGVSGILRSKDGVCETGWCHRHEDKLMLIYDYMPNGSLDKHLFNNDDNSNPLNWDLRNKIIVGVASALHYLHNLFDERVIHRDLKASNIMLDSRFNAKLGDFGLARTLDNERTSYAEASGFAGTRGYIAPEYMHTGKATEQSDVYAFGAVLLEVVCGRKPLTQIDEHQFLVDWVWELHHEGRLLEAIDSRLGEDYQVEEAERVLLLGLACSHPAASERPKTPEIVQILARSVPVPQVPSQRPPFVWAFNTPATTNTTSFMTSTCESTWTIPIAMNSEIQHQDSDSFSNV
ncbi:hypothetical protein Vadar_006608 [Vaccinium darrowii]|uniref:Uncharacterized protein n=1 Tax=Vaccinium darrowii TaxID=229202 RepID=A0ACB7Y5Q8_9ERIC|nr:hypothetical protein Vadar_006608 [Vaccinium darrowii]